MRYSFERLKVIPFQAQNSMLPLSFFLQRLIAPFQIAECFLFASV
jgi:hypothetical protein